MEKTVLQFMNKLLVLSLLFLVGCAHNYRGYDSYYYPVQPVYYPRYYPQYQYHHNQHHNRHHHHEHRDRD